MFTARGSIPRSRRISANASSMPETTRSARTTAMCVSGSSVVAVGVSAPDKHDQRTRLGDRAEAAGDPESIAARRRSRLDLEAGALPVEVGELRPADAGVRLLRRDRRRQDERIEIAHDSAGNLAPLGDPLDSALHVGRPRHELGDKVGRHRRPRPVRMGGDVSCRLRNPRAADRRSSQATSSPGRGSRRARRDCWRDSWTSSAPLLSRFPHHGTVAALQVPAHERVEPCDAVANGFRRRRVGEADVLAVAGHATAEMDIGEHRDACLDQQALAERLRIGAAGDRAGFGDIGPCVERAAGRLCT